MQVPLVVACIVETFSDSRNEFQREYLKEQVVTFELDVFRGSHGAAAGESDDLLFHLRFSSVWGVLLHCVRLMVSYAFSSFYITVGSIRGLVAN